PRHPHSFPTRRSSDLLMPHGPVLERLLALGVAPEDITTLVRGMQSAALFHCCAVLDRSAGIPEGVEDVAVEQFGVFELDDSGRRSEEHTSELQSPYDL